MYKIMDHYTGKTYKLNGSQKLDSFRTKAEADEYLQGCKKLALDESVSNIWLAYVKKQ